MAANKSALAILAALGLLAMPWASANDEVLERLGQDVALKLVHLEQTTGQCQQKQTTSAAPSLSREEIKALGLTREESIYAIGYLHQRNDYACTHQALIELLFAATLQQYAQKAYEQTPTEFAQVLAELTQPNTRYFEMAIAYAKLSQAARNALEKAFGTEPFDLNAALEKIPEH